MSDPDPDPTDVPNNDTAQWLASLSIDIPPPGETDLPQDESFPTTPTTPTGTNNSSSFQDEERGLFPRFMPCRRDFDVPIPPEQKWKDNQDMGFSHSPLLPGRSIRLAVLQPGKEDEPIACRLTTVLLDDNPQYESLSYVWGDTFQHAQIRVDGTPFRVTYNLYGALNRIRSESSERTLWVDAICIDQGNLEERSAQVQMMRDIYRQASRVLIWLGPRDVRDETAMRLINRLASEAARTTGNTEGTPKPASPQKEKLSVVHPVGRGLNRATSAALTPGGWGFEVEDEWDALFCFFELPYFCRTWVIQEVQSNTNRLVLCGAAETNFESVEHAARTAFRSPEAIQAKMYTDRGISNALYIRSLATAGASLLSRLEQTRGFFATDPRDKIYAFLRPEDSLVPDYSKSITSVFLDAARQMLCENGLDVLSFVFHRHYFRMESDLMPSWVPIFNQPFLIPLQRVSGLAAGGPTDSASWDVEGKKLKITAFPVDRITTVFPVMHWDNFSIPPSTIGLPTSLDRMWHLYAAKDNPNNPYPSNSCSFREAFAATLTAGLGHWGLEPTVQHHLAAFTEFTEQLFGSAPTISHRLQDEEGDRRRRCCTNLPNWVEDEIKFINYNGGVASALKVDETIAPPAPASAATYQLYQRAAQSVCNNRCLFRTEKGYLGLGPSVMYSSWRKSWDEAGGMLPEQDLDRGKGDEAFEVWVVPGGRTPLVLLPRGGCYLLAGECYVHGLMGGEGLAEGLKVVREVELV